MNRKRILLTALLLSAIHLGSGAASKANASGYALFTQGASALGQGNAVTAHTDDPSTIFYNPALMTKLDGTQLSLGTTVIYSSHEFDGELSSTSNHTTFTPINFYATHKFNDKLSAGLGIFNPFGLGTEWNQDWQGRYIATKSQLTTFNFNPVVAYQVLPSLSFAAGVDVIKLDATLERKIPSVALGLPLGPDVSQKFDGDGTGVGFNLAAAYDVTEKVTVGASYRSEVDVDVTGNSTTSLGAGPLDSKGKTSITLPRQVTAGIAYHVIDPLILEAGIRWEGWSAFKELDLSLDSGFSSTQQRNWHDTLGVNFGGKYRLNDTVSLLAGYIYGSNAVPSYTFDPSIPDSDTHIFCFGSDLNFKPFKVGVSYAYQYYTDRNKNNQIGASPLDPSLSTAANGKYQSDAHLFAVNLGYKF